MSLGTQPHLTRRSALPQSIVKLLLAKLPESERNAPSPEQQAQLQQQAHAQQQGQQKQPRGPPPPNPVLALYAAAHHGDIGAIRKMLAEVR